MKVGIIWKNDYPWDVRVEKIARALLSSGHEVYILSANVQGLARSELLDGLHIRRTAGDTEPLANAIIRPPFYLNPFVPPRLPGGGPRAHRPGHRPGSAPHSVGVLVGIAFPAFARLDMAEDYRPCIASRSTSGDGGPWAYLIAKNPLSWRFVERAAAAG